MKDLKNIKCFMLSIVIVAGGVSSVLAAVGDELHKLTASDAAAGDIFGSAVAIDGNIAIVGSPDDDDAGNFSGSAYLYDANTGNELFKLTANDAAANDAFGGSVAIDGNIAIVGSRYDKDAGNSSGSAYLFDVNTGNELFKLTASDAAAYYNFGLSVAIDGNIAIVGSNNDNDAIRQSGSAYLFDVNTGTELFKLTASDPGTYDNFGCSVAIDGNIAIVGALSNDDAGSDSGSAYLFDVNTGNELFKLTASDAAAGDLFGRSVAIDGNIAIVGADCDDDAGSDSGSAYLFDVNSGNELFKLTASDAAEGDRFGLSVAIDGNIAIVGSQFDDDAGSSSGSVYLFDTNTGHEIIKLTASDAAVNDNFGHSVAIDGNMAIVGAFDNDDAGIQSGSAYLFDVVPEPTCGLLLLAGCSLTLGRRRVV